MLSYATEDLVSLKQMRSLAESAIKVLIRENMETAHGLGKKWRVPVEIHLPESPSQSEESQLKEWQYCVQSKILLRKFQKANTIIQFRKKLAMAAKSVVYKILSLLAI